MPRAYAVSESNPVPKLIAAGGGVGIEAALKPNFVQSDGFYQRGRRAEGQIVLAQNLKDHGLHHGPFGLGNGAHCGKFLLHEAAG